MEGKPAECRWCGTREGVLVFGTTGQTYHREGEDAPTRDLECIDRIPCAARAAGRREELNGPAGTSRSALRRRVLPETPPGFCRWCGGGIYNPETGALGWRGRRYHREKGPEGESCLSRSLAYLDPTNIDNQVLEDQDMKCAVCGAELAENPWDLDHIQPLADGGTNARENLQVICRTPCHKRKTAREASERAARRRKAKQDRAAQQALL